MELDKALEELKKLAKKNNNIISESKIAELVSEFDYDQALDLLDKENIEIVADAEEINPLKLEKDYETIIKTNDIVKIYFNEIGNYRILTNEEEIELFKVYREGLNAKEMINKLDNDDLNTISQEEYIRLYNLVDKADKAYEKIVYSNLKLVASIAKKYIKRGLSLMDLIQEGNIGLTKAISKFDYERGNKFSTCATPWIRQAMTRALTDKSRTIRIPSHLLETISKIKKAEDKLEHELGRKPTYDEIAVEVNMSSEKLTMIMNSYQTPISLEKPIGEDDDGTIGDVVPDKSSLNPLEYCERIAISQDLKKLLDEKLTEREATILKMRYGFDDGNPKTLEEIGKIMGNISKERIRQIEVKAIRKLKNIKEAIELAESYRK